VPPLANHDDVVIRERRIEQQRLHGEWRDHGLFRRIGSLVLCGNRRRERHQRENEDEDELQS
jgi:hypothetical protein